MRNASAGGTVGLLLRPMCATVGLPNSVKRAPNPTVIFYHEKHETTRKVSGSAITAGFVIDIAALLFKYWKINFLK